MVVLGMCVCAGDFCLLYMFVICTQSGDKYKKTQYNNKAKIFGNNKIILYITVEGI